ncbi:MAG TPA: GIY-YIG nuclease family protein [Bacteroidales bacterium]
MPYYVYILYSQSTDHYYVGHTNDLRQRIDQHNAGRTPSTKTGRPWTLVYKETYPDKSSAFRRELEIKNKKSRKYIEQLISSAG